MKDARNHASDDGRKPETEADARDHAAPEPTDGAARDSTTPRQEQVAEAAADVAATQAPAGNEGSTRGSGDEVSSPTPSHRSHLATPGPTTIPAGPTDSWTRTAAVQSGPSPFPAHQQNQATGRQAGSGPFPDAAQPGAGKVAEAGGRPNAPSADFQNALQAAGRLRGQFLTSPSKAAAAVTGKAAGANGINLDESRSVTELARIVRSSIGSRHSTMILRLDPPELGQLRIDVRMHDQALTLRLEAHTLAGHEALQGRLTDLRAALEQHGIQLNQVEVEFRPGPSPASEPQNPDNQQQSTSQWGESASGGPAERDQTGTGGDGFAPSTDADGVTTSPGGDELLEAEEYDGVERPAETGVNLVV